MDTTLVWPYISLVAVNEDHFVPEPNSSGNLTQHHTALFDASAQCKVNYAPRLQSPFPTLNSPIWFLPKYSHITFCSFPGDVALSLIEFHLPVPYLFHSVDEYYQLF